MTADDLIEIERIKRVKYAYMRALDTQDWALMRSIFADDARAWYDSGRLSAQGADAIVAMVSAGVDGKVVSSHVALHPEIDLVAPDRAVGRWRFEDTVIALDGAAGAMRPGDMVRGAGCQTDEYVKLGGEWKIASTGYVRLYHRLEPADGGTAHLRAEPARGALERLPEDVRNSLGAPRR